MPNLSRFEGAGVYYGATFMEAQLCGGEEVIVVGGGNSAGQAAVFLAQTARRVHMLVRADGSADTMSRYLVRRIEENPAIIVRTRTEIVALEGDGSSGARALAQQRSREHRGARHQARVRHDRRGPTRTGSTAASRSTPRVHHDGTRPAAATIWRPRTGRSTRPPYLLETSLPGVFAVGDVRAGNVKRVASAVGEGSIAIAFVHRVLRGITRGMSCLRPPCAHIDAITTVKQPRRQSARNA